MGERMEIVEVQEALAVNWKLKVTFPLAGKWGCYIISFTQ